MTRVQEILCGGARLRECNATVVGLSVFCLISAFDLHRISFIGEMMTSHRTSVKRKGNRERRGVVLLGKSYSDEL